MAGRRTGVCPLVTPRARACDNLRRYPWRMSIFRSVTSTAGRVAHDMRGSVHRARLEGEKRVLERRHRQALAALGARAYALSQEGALTADALAPEIAEVEARMAAVRAAREVQAEEDTAHDAVAAFPMLAEDQAN